MELLHNFLASVLTGLDLMSFSIVLLFILVIMLFVIAQYSDELDWIDMIRKPGRKEISLTKVVQLFGAIVATWIMVKLSLTDKMTWDIFAVYLTYVGGVEGFSKYITAKYGEKLSGTTGDASVKSPPN
jgi:steroid 5-alpha reductase family enzyme